MDIGALIAKIKDSGHRHKMQLLAVLMTMLCMSMSASAAVNFTEAGQTIDAVRTDLISPIAMLVISLIALFVALFVISMLGDIFEGVGSAVKRRV